MRTSMTGGTSRISNRGPIEFKWKFPGRFLPGKQISGSFFLDFGKIPEILNFNFETVKVAMEKICLKVKHSSSGPLLFAGKGIKGLSQTGRFLWASEV